MGNSLKITKQPVSVMVSSGESARVTVTATGDGLTYKWYFKNPGSEKFSYTSTFKSNYYQVAMSEDRSGRQVYCVVSDKYGNSVQTETVTISIESNLEIIKQPESVMVAEGETAYVSFEAEGDGLTYK